jgi:hypothetical protein
MTQSSNDDAPPNHEYGLELYRIALDEYRFQVNLNWQRTQHYFVLNLAIVGAAIALLKAGAAGSGSYLLVAGLFLCGSLTAALAIVSSITQQRYYHETREHKRLLETSLGLGSFAIQTTYGMRREKRRLPSVTFLTLVVFAAIAVTDLGGSSYTTYEYAIRYGAVLKRTSHTSSPKRQLNTTTPPQLVVLLPHW